MTIRPILIHPDPRLKKVCAPVASITDGLRALAEDMIATMQDAPGIGLAAPQIGVLKRLIVMDCTAKDEDPAPVALFNPTVVWSSEALNTYEEGCLSIPEMYEEVTRPAEVRVTFTDTSGEQREEHYDGMWATCVQHEIDHLNGTLFIDYLSKVKRAMITGKMKKLKKEKARA